MFKTKSSLYKILAMLACFSFMLNNSLLSVDTEDNEDLIAQNDPEEDIREAKEALGDATPPLTPEQIDRITNADFYKQKDIRDFLNQDFV